MNPARNNNNSTYGYPCEYCEGTVQPKTVAREAFKHKKGFIILEAVIIGICGACRSRYYSANILHAVNDIASGRNHSKELRRFLLGTHSHKG